MRLLLDTDALIWAVQSPERLSEPARSVLTADGAEVDASYVSLWEMTIKQGLGKLDQLDRAAADWFDHFVPKSGLRQLPIAASHLGAVEDLPRLHHDPFDRLLVTQARLMGMAMVTHDRHVTQYDIDVVW